MRRFDVELERTASDDGAYGYAGDREIALRLTLQNNDVVRRFGEVAVCYVSTAAEYDARRKAVEELIAAADRVAHHGYDMASANRLANAVAALREVEGE